MTLLHEIESLEELYRQRDVIDQRIEAIKTAEKAYKSNDFDTAEEILAIDERLDLILDKYPEYNNEHFIKIYMQTPINEIHLVEKRFNIDPNPNTPNESMFRQQVLAKIPEIQRQHKIREFKDIDDTFKSTLDKKKFKQFKRKHSTYAPRVI